MRAPLTCAASRLALDFDLILRRFARVRRHIDIAVQGRLEFSSSSALVAETLEASSRTARGEVVRCYPMAICASRRAIDRARGRISLSLHAPSGSPYYTKVQAARADGEGRECRSSEQMKSRVQGQTRARLSQ